jgi:hypothetical protein
MASSSTGRSRVGGARRAVCRADVSQCYIGAMHRAATSLGLAAGAGTATASRGPGSVDSDLG